MRIFSNSLDEEGAALRAGSPSYGVFLRCGIAWMGWVFMLSGCVVERPSHPEAGHVHVSPPLPVPTEYVGDFGAWEDHFYRWDGTRYTPFWMRGVDLGVGMPGTQPGDLAPRYDDYRRWFADMSARGINTLRIYTLHFPRFYEAIADHNEANPQAPLYVLHGVWLTANRTNDGQDLHDLTEDFDGRIEEVIDAVHGSLTVAHRYGQAHGEYTRDISAWVCGYLIGREIYDTEVIETDEIHGRHLAFTGRYFSLPDGTASEVWAVARLEHTVAYETQRYGESHAAGFSSWVPLDPLTHPTEPWYSGEDVASIHLLEVDAREAPNGTFISYHAYPYYPHFMNDDPAYREVSDRLGTNTYLAYLRELADHYEGRPLLISEFGLPSSWGSAKRVVSGMHHGGHSEADQARYIERMIENLASVNVAGAVYFHWMDGWYKATWITDPRTFPRERYRLWHDVMNPQQGYGLVSFDPLAPTFEALDAFTAMTTVPRIEADADPRFFHVRLTLASALASDEEVLVAFDTYDDELGESRLSDGSTPGGRYEFLLRIEGHERAELRVMSSYDLYGIESGASPNPVQPMYGAGALGPSVAGLPSARFHFRATRSDAGHWSEMYWNTRPGVDVALGDLGIRDVSEPASSLDAVVVDGNQLLIQVPWTLLNFADPSTLSVVHDDPETVAIEGRESEGIRIGVVFRDQSTVSRRFRWEGWDRVPATVERAKPALDALERAFSAIEMP